MSEPVAQDALEARMRELSDAGGGEIDMGGARVLIDRPPLTVPKGVRLSGCLFEVIMQLPGPGEPWSASYQLPDFASVEGGCGTVSLGPEGRLTVEVSAGGSIASDDVIEMPDGILLADVPPFKREDPVD